MCFIALVSMCFIAFSKRLGKDVEKNKPWSILRYSVSICLEELEKTTELL